MGTRFVATHECDVSQEFKDAYLSCRKEDIVIIDSPVGLPGRAIRDEFLERVSSGIKETFKCPWKCLRSCDFKNVPYCIALALTKAKEGKMESCFELCQINVSSDILLTFFFNYFLHITPRISGKMDATLPFCPTASAC